MFALILLFAILSSPIVSILGLPLTTPDISRLRPVYQFPNETWVENLAVRSNGKILVTLITAAEVWEIDPFATPATAELIHHFPHLTSALGIAEVEEDVFAIAVGNWSAATFQATNGSWSVWSLDLRGRHYGGWNDKVPVNKITDIPAAVFLNGMAPLPSEPASVLVADSGLGLVYKVNTLTGSYSTVLDEPGFKPSTSAVAQLGINGIRTTTLDGTPFLYFTNSFSPPVLGRLPLNADGTAAGPAKSVVPHATFPTNLDGHADDFALDADAKTAWVTTDPSNQLLKVDVQTGGVEVVAGGQNSSAIAGDTSAQFGRTESDSEVLYITTNGGMADPASAGVQGGKIVAFDTKGL